jgi:hypothetical protein
MGYYREGDRRYRLAAIVKGDPDQAKDVIKTARSRPGSLPIPSVPGADEAVHVVLQASPEAPKVEWLLARKGALVAAAGDDELAIKPSDPPAAQQAARLTKDEAIAKLKPWLAAPAPAASAPKK